MMKINFKEDNVNDLHPHSAFELEVINFVKDWFSASNTVDVTTSGSTGSPKTLKIEKHKMRNSAKMTCDFFGFKTGNSALICLPIAYISGKMMVVRAIERNLILTVGNLTTNPLHNLVEKIHFCAMTPLQVENSLDQLPLIQNLIIGGAQVSENLKMKIFQHLEKHKGDNRIFETYGMSETLSHIALKEIYPNASEYFTVLDGVEISRDERGCLIIEAPHLAAETLVTNDIIEILDERHFKFLGRTDFIINSGGVKISPEILENFVKKELAKIPFENEILFAGAEDEVLGQKLVLFIEGKMNPAIINAIENMPFEQKFYRPKEIIFLEKFPRSENGKIVRRAIYGA